MKKNLLLIIAITFGINLCHAQSKSADVTWGAELKKEGRIAGIETIGFDETGYYLFTTSITGLLNIHWTMQKLDNKLNMIASVEIDSKDHDTKMRLAYEGSYLFNDELLLFQSSEDKDAKKNILYVRRVNKKTLEPQGKFIKLAEIDYESKRNAGDFRISTSKDKSKLLIAYNLPYEKKETEKYGAVVCDSTLKVLWKKEFELPYQDKLFIVENWKCDDAGSVYMLGKLYEGKVKDIVRGKQNFAYHMVAYLHNGMDKVEYEIKLQDKFITDIKFAISDKGDIITSGFYSKEGEMSVDGAFYMVLDGVTKNVKLSNIKEFGIDFLVQGMSERQERKARRKEEKGKDQELYSYDLHELVLRDDGGAVLVGEQYFVVVTTYTTSNGNTRSTSTRYTYNYDNIIVVNISPLGKIEWAQQIPKKQVSTDDGGFYSSYALQVNKSKLHFIFNDNAENLNIQNGAAKNFKIGEKGIVAMVTMNADGTMTRESLFSNAETEVRIRPKVCDQISDEQMLLYGERRKHEQFALMNFKD